MMPGRRSGAGTARWISMRPRSVAPVACACGAPEGATAAAVQCPAAARRQVAVTTAKSRMSEPEQQLSGRQPDGRGPAAVALVELHRALEDQVALNVVAGPDLHAHHRRVPGNVSDWSLHAAEAEVLGPDGRVDAGHQRISTLDADRRRPQRLDLPGRQQRHLPVAADRLDACQPVPSRVLEVESVGGLREIVRAEGAEGVERSAADEGAARERRADLETWRR